MNDAKPALMANGVQIPGFFLGEQSRIASLPAGTFLHMKSVIAMTGVAVAVGVVHHPDRVAQVRELQETPGILWKASLVDRFASKAPGASKSMNGVLSDWREALQSGLGVGETRPVHCQREPDRPDELRFGRGLAAIQAAILVRAHVAWYRGARCPRVVRGSDGIATVQLLFLHGVLIAQLVTS